MSQILAVSGDAERKSYRDEQPAHEVRLDGFWIDRTEVTNAPYCALLTARSNQVEEGVRWWEPGAGHRGIVYGFIQEREGQYRPRPGYEDYPVIEVSWYGTRAYCEWVGERLPTEAEWEYAARGPAASLFPWGDGPAPSRACHGGTISRLVDGSPGWSPVGSHPSGASWCGALGMAGNVWEWVSDWWSAGYYATSPGENPDGPVTDTVRVARGGSWYEPAWRLPSGDRKGLSSSSSRMHWVGFQCVIPAE